MTFCQATFAGFEKARGMLDSLGVYFLGTEQWEQIKFGVTCVVMAILFFAFVGIMKTCQTVCNWVCWPWCCCCFSFSLSLGP